MRTSTLTITRDIGGGYYDVEGRWVEGPAPETFNISCNIQPFKMGEVQSVLPEGTSANNAVIVRTPTALKTSEQVGDKEKADTTVIDGFTYEAFFAENWSRYSTRTDHYKVTFIRKDQPSGGSL
jgi:hypothetical protein